MMAATKIAIILACVACYNHFCLARRGKESQRPLPVAFDEDDVIQIVNTHPDKAWKAEKTQFYGKKKHLTQRLGTKDLDDAEFAKLPKGTPRSVNRAALPAQFDARTRWPTCVSIKEVRDQGGCGSCWALSVAAALSDRICIKSPRQWTYAHISSQDFMTCCSKCGGCYGGYVEYAYEYFTNTGAVTGGEYTNNTAEQTGCRPYSIPLQWDYTITPPCTKSCQSSYYRNYQQDTYQGTSWYTVSKVDAYGTVSDDTETNIKTEIMTNGPVSCSMKVYEDFGTYKSGVYQHLTGAYLGSHAVKCLGWGVDAATNVPYWLAANSWGPGWGEGGFFRIRRGTNECNIEGRVNAGFPKQYG
ncbi:cathepsin B-like cysteine proteinase [Paramacrobiotus metropolitanus]|uniref:cathepsin B-like cysteine proteinase n=1 Tax=Paramacrobiotus metropolitanus TaxID=2943436 RepID=UPI002445605A|nr:cathepsin B-like cysteine proteinase [Paramacrobiotus metropolitanus]